MTVYETKSYVTADAAVRYKNDNGFSANLMVKNLTNENYYLHTNIWSAALLPHPGARSS